VIVRDNEDLAPYTTFGVQARCKTLVTVESAAELRDALHAFPEARVLGGGSNVLVVTDLLQPVIRVAMLDRSVLSEDEHTVHVEVASGENWHGFVTWCVDHGYGGLENLALIPGTVGAAPMQNIGAYGIEQEHAFVCLHAMDRTTGDVQIFERASCRFGYRTSVFKEELSNKYVITKVVYRLSKGPHVVHTTYRDVAEELGATSAIATIKDVFDAVVQIRMRKLPDPRQVGNAGSFFKNPVVDAEVFSKLVEGHPDVPHYDLGGGEVKVPAAWLIDQCGWKGYRESRCGVHERQPLVIINLGGASGREILDLSERVRESVLEQFGIALEREVNVWSD
jgi:UDP-N-acetylmuramate dehydrogenase